MRNLPLTTLARPFKVEVWNANRPKPNASGRITSPRRAGHRWLGGTATEARRKGRGTEEGVGGLLRTPDLGAIRYRDFREVPGGGSRTNNLLSTKTPLPSD